MVLPKRPPGGEIIVERVRSRRFAVQNGDYDQFYEQGTASWLLNALWSVHPRTTERTMALNALPLDTAIELEPTGIKVNASIKSSQVSWFKRCALR